jgi:hypothetical protein
MMLPASEMLVPINNAKSFRLQERNEVGVEVKEMEGKKVGCRGRSKRKRRRRGEGQQGERERRRKGEDRRGVSMKECEEKIKDQNKEKNLVFLNKAVQHVQAI